MNEEPLPNGLTFGSLQSFLRVADSGGYLTAADGDQGRAANLKNQVKRLAEGLAVPLTQPEGRGIRLTARGLALKRLAAEILGLVGSFRDACAEERQVVRIGSGQSFVNLTFVPKWGAIRKALPDLRFHFENLRTKSTLASLLDQRIDFGVVRRSAVTGTPGLKVWPLQTMRFVLLVPERLVRHLKTGGQKLPKRLEVATITGDGEFRTQLNEFARKQGIALDYVIECPSFAQATAFALSGSLTAIVPDSGVVPEGVARFYLDPEEGLDRQLVLAWLPRRLEMLEHLEKARTALLKIIAET